jgi:hypothetical protein
VLAIDDIPQDKRLDQLDEEEREGVCDWSRALVDRALSGGLRCNGRVYQAMVSVCTMFSPTKCKTTVGQARACTEALFDRIAEDPCFLIELDAENLSEVSEEIPECKGLDSCT